MTEFTSHGLNCLSLYVNSSHWCGYVEVPEGHPAWGRSEVENDMSVHGGITWSRGISPQAIETDSWWFGFDCAHAGDVTAYFSGPNDVYRTEEYVMAECKSLAKQLVNWSPSDV